MYKPIIHIPFDPSLDNPEGYQHVLNSRDALLIHIIHYPYKHIIFSFLTYYY